MDEDSDNDLLPEIEYCPPKITPLPDYPDSEDEEILDLNIDFSKTGSLFNPVEADGRTKREREEQEEEDRIDRYMDYASLESLRHSFPEKDFPEMYQSMREALQARWGDAPQEAPKAPGSIPSISITKKKEGIPGDRAKSAVAALSKPGPRFAAPTASTAAKKAGVGGPLRQGSGATVSRSTIGYAAGRKVSASLKKSVQEEEQPRVGVLDRVVHGAGSQSEGARYTFHEQRQGRRR